jgi:protein-L-isoaspartate(D-aspartate) O-methyltransferase
MQSEQYEAVRLFYADLVTAKGGVRDEAIKGAFAWVPRERFVGPGPWRIFTAAGYIETPSDDPGFLYQDIVVGLATERLINNGEPNLHARCLGALAPKSGEHILHVGAGTGYYSALLAELVGMDGSVDAYEIEADIAERAANNLSDRRNVRVHSRSGSVGPLPKCDGIYVNAGATAPVAAWLDALNDGGRLLFPLTPDEGAGGMLLVHRKGDSFDARIISWAMFIPCIGARDATQSKRLSEAFQRKDIQRVRSLRRDETPDPSCWVQGNGWWLSTEAA